ncbi:DUF4838 domain-containing protein [Paludisphaera sp.]|uniref:DUF4838 domain-containing protein n=1 Tax=Paludisphaera sp. TaxID=2017432 RepID=UPI00301E4829
MIDRRSFLAVGLTAALAARTRASAGAEEGFQTRGVVLTPEDFSLADWPERARRAGLTTIGIHHQNSPGAVVEWAASDAGARVLEDCERLGLEVEYELHAMKELLPRELFAKEPTFFRLDADGRRNADSNCCPASTRALDIIAENAAAIAGKLRPTTGRYYFWGDDGLPWCACPECRELSPSEQALLVENRLLRAIKAVDPRATLAHLAYHDTLPPPRKVKPEPGVFLEYAPIHRSYDVPYERQTGPASRDGLPMLDANLEVFPAATARVLEYWLDVSLFSRWKRPAVKLPWRPDVLAADVASYAARGIRHVSSFAVYVDAHYAERYGEPTFLDEYGAALKRGG